MTGIWHISELDLMLRVFISAGLGGLIGLEREWSNHSAGLRTHILVCIGSTVIMLLSMYGFSGYVAEESVRMDPARLAAQVISGIGFLGAGAILRNGSTVSGLTTAASIWVVAAIGLCVGAGFLFTASITTIVVLAILFVLNKIENLLMRHRRQHEIMIRFEERDAETEEIYALLREQRIKIAAVQLRTRKRIEDDGATKTIREMKLNVKVNNHSRLNEAIENIMRIESVLSTRTGLLRVAERSKEGRRKGEAAALSQDKGL